MSSHGSDKEEGRDGSGIISYEQLPLDLMEAIFWRLPAKYVVRLCCVSKNLWSSIITTSYFLNHPSNQPHLLVSQRKESKLLITALSQHPDTPTKRFESYHMPMSIDYGTCSGSTRGLICFNNCTHHLVGVWNPSMRQCVVFPQRKVRMYPICLLGYDPIEDKYKLLGLTSSIFNGVADVLTLGAEESWRRAKGYHPLHLFVSHGPCINGVMYYAAKISDGVDDTRMDKDIIMRFDVRFEIFKVMDIIPQRDTCRLHDLFNYQGKLAWVCGSISSMKLWVLEDDEKQEWSCRDLLLPIASIDPIWSSKLSSKGAVDHTGELIFIAYSQTHYHPFSILYYDPKRNNVRVVKYGEFTGGINVEESVRHFFFPNHIENFMSLKGLSHAVDILHDSYNDLPPKLFPDFCLYRTLDGKQK